MIFFLAAFGAVADVGRARPALGDSLSSTLPFEGEQRAWTARSGMWSLATVALADPLLDERVVVDGDDVIVANGPIVPATGDRRRLMRRALDAYRARGARGATEVVDGSYNLVAATSERGMVATVDWSGMTPLYWYADGNVVWISNRSLAIARAAGCDGWDAASLAWILAHVNLVGDRVVARHVRYVAPGMQLCAPLGSATVREERSPSWFWPARDDDGERGRDNLGDREWNDVTDVLVERIRAVASTGAPISIPLTGGKDSRLCLALGKAAGLRDGVTVYNSGGPELELARVVAERAGYEFRHGEAPTGARPAAAATAATPTDDGRHPVWAQLEHNIVRYEAIVGAWSALQNATTANALTMMGFGGEFFRRGNDKAFRNKDPRTIKELIGAFVAHHESLDVLGIIAPDVAASQRAWIAAWVNANAAEVRLDLLPEKFYVDFRLGHWSGPNLQCVPFAPMLNPLASEHAARVNTELSARARNAERFHYEVMRRAAPELVTLPFYKDGWAAAIVADADAPLPLAPKPSPAWRSTLGRVARPIRRRGRAPSGSARPPSLNPAWRFLDGERAAIDRLFADAVCETELANICDVDKLRALLRRGEPIRTLGPAREVTNAIGVALTLLERKLIPGR